MCQLRELQDGTYSIDDVEDMHEALDLQYAMNQIMRAEAEAEAKAGAS